MEQAGQQIRQACTRGGIRQASVSGIAFPSTPTGAVDWEETPLERSSPSPDPLESESSTPDKTPGSDTPPRLEVKFEYLGERRAEKIYINIIKSKRT